MSEISPVHARAAVEDEDIRFHWVFEGVKREVRKDVTCYSLLNVPAQLGEQVTKGSVCGNTQGNDL